MTTRINSSAPKTASRGTRKLAGGASDAPATGVDLTSAAASSNPKMPHDRDETVGMTGGVPSARVQQGARDLKRGVQDTSRAPEADNAYKKLTK